MHRHRFVARLATCLAAVAALLVAGAGIGQAAPPTGSGGTGGTAHGTGATPLFTFSFDVTEHGNNPLAASGYFTAAPIPPVNSVVAPQGPATCVDVRGDSVGFLYPLAQGTKPAPVPAASILITAHDGGPGKPDSLGFVGPLPTAAFGGHCAPSLPTMPVTSGDIVVHPGS